jgi:hypothetical protein
MVENQARQATARQSSEVVDAMGLISGWHASL